MTPREICQHLLDRSAGKTRLMVAIAGPPGSGKSTLAACLCDDLIRAGERAAVVPMDGFHLDNAILDQRGQRSRKGSPPTFDAPGFVHLIRRLSSAEGAVVIPVFDRSRDISVAGAAVVDPSVKIVLVEGNYLLLKDSPWNALADIWDETIMLDPGLDVIEQRLIQRWLDNGLSHEAARKRALENDIPNARTVLENSFSAGLHIC